MTKTETAVDEAPVSRKRMLIATTSSVAVTVVLTVAANVLINKVADRVQTAINHNEDDE